MTSAARRSHAASSARGISPASNWLTGVIFSFRITIPEVVDQYGSTKPRHRRVARGTFDFEAGESCVVEMTFDVAPVASSAAVTSERKKRETLRRLSPKAAEQMDEREKLEAKKRETLRRLQTPPPEDPVERDVRYMLDGLFRRPVL